KVREVATHNFACGMEAGKWLFGSNEDFKVINNAIDVSRFTYNPVTRASIRKKLEISDTKIIGHIGRFNEQKNHFYLIKIFQELLKIDQSYHLLLVGDGNLSGRIKELVDDLNISEN